MAAIVGAAGLAPTLAAARAGKKILLANKEALVLSGQLFMDAVAASGAILLPIDSEHNAIFQSLPMAYGRAPEASGVAKIVLTASGGPFLKRAVETLEEVTPEQACKHPNWSMGRKISVDSATMMNKGLEVIEAHWLFGASAERIEVVIHPQSVIHSMVSYVDGSVLAQLGNPDMRTPIAHALAFPERIDSGVAQLDLTAMAALQFEKPDYQRFPCLALAFDALRAGGTAPALLNAANEVAVEAFLERRIGFRDIDRVVARVMNENDHGAAASIEAVMAQDARRPPRRRRHRRHPAPMNTVTPILAFILALGPLIIFHELGHYLVARLCGVKVLRFSVGMGKVVWSRKFGPDQTEWAVSALPLGGYVKMLDARDPERRSDPEDAHREFTAPVGVAPHRHRRRRPDRQFSAGHRAAGRPGHGRHQRAGRAPARARCRQRRLASRPARR